MKRASVAFALALGALCSSAREAEAYCRTTTRGNVGGCDCATDGRPLAWQSLCAGFSLYQPGSPFAADVFGAVAARAAARWHEVNCGAGVEYFQLQRIADTLTPTGYAARGPNANTVAFNPTWAPDAIHRLETIAVTIVTYDATTGEILDADVEMNLKSDRNPDGFQFSTTDTPDPNAADLVTILTHEFGHIHGIAHTCDMNAVMWPTAGLGQPRRDPQPDDRGAICEIYPPDAVPELLCNPTPYGGFASNPGGGRITGGCAVPPRGPRGDSAFSASGAALALAGTLAAWRGRARAARSRDGR